MASAADKPATNEPVATGAAGDGIQDLIIGIIHERTGFPKESITPDLRLLDDLKSRFHQRRETSIATAARKLGALGPIDPASLADASIDDVVNAVRAATGDESPAEVAAPAPLAAAAPSSSPLMAATAALSTEHGLTATAIMGPNGSGMGGTVSFSSAAPTQTQPTTPVSVEAIAAEASTQTPTAAATPTAEKPTVQAPISDDGIQKMIVDIIHDRTGFPPETLTADLRLLDDLNLDSIKAGDVIATAARRLGALGPIDPASLADATIGDVAAAVRQAQGGGAEVASAAPVAAPATLQVESAAHGESAAAPAADAIASPQAAPMHEPAQPAALTRSPAQPAAPAAPVPAAPPSTSTSVGGSPPVGAATQVPGWVRNFAVELVPHRPKSRQLPLEGRHYRVLYEPNQQPFVDLLCKQLRERKASVSCELYDQAGVATGDALVEGASFFVIAVMPKQGHDGTARERLQRAIARLRRAVAATNPAVVGPRAEGVCFVQFGDGQFGHGAASDPECCTTAGFARALHLESPGLQVRIVDFADKLSDFLASDFVTNELAAEESFRDAALRLHGAPF